MRYQMGIILASMFLMPGAVLGEEAARAESEIKTVKIVLHPMAEPQPALKYKLLPAFIDLKPGNAAVFYNKLYAESSILFNEIYDNEKAWDWPDASLPEIRSEKVRKIIRGWTWKIDEIKRASQCEYCDWQTPIREYGTATPLADIMQTYGFAHLLAPYARLQIAEGEYGEAIQTLQAGYALGRNVSNGPTLVHNLIGCSIVGMMSSQVREMIQQPGAPNIYWALTDLPRPIIDFRLGMKAEYDVLYINFPDLRNLENKELATEQWAMLFKQTLHKLVNLAKKRSDPAPLQYLSVFILLEKYPQAKSFLTERGWTANMLEDMPVCQVVLIAALRQYEEIRDDMFKWIYLPYPEAVAGMKKADAKMKEMIKSGQEIMPITSILMPAISTAKNTETRTERDIAILRIFEAMRLYAAAHEGHMPDRLSDITNVPVPIDPISGTAFIYNRIDNMAILEAPAPSGLTLDAYWLRYEIHLESKGK